jgi:hypothetical protein
MAGKLTDLLAAGLAAQLPLSGQELIEISQDVGLPTLQTRVTNVNALAAAIVNIVGGPVPAPSANFGARLHDDFLSSLLSAGSGNARGPLGLVTIVDGAGFPAVTHQGLSQTDHPGVYLLHTGATAETSVAMIIGSNINVPSPGHKTALEVLVSSDFPLPEAAANYRAEIGFAALDLFYTGMSALYSAFFYHQHGTNGGRWTIRVNNGGAPIDFDTGVMPDWLTWQRLKVEFDPPFTNFYISDALVLSSPDGPTSGVTVAMIPALIRKTAGEAPAAQVANMMIDYASLILEYAGGR